MIICTTKHNVQHCDTGLHCHRNQKRGYRTAHSIMTLVTVSGSVCTHGADGSREMSPEHDHGASLSTRDNPMPPAARQPAISSTVSSKGCVSGGRGGAAPSPLIAAVLCQFPITCTEHLHLPGSHKALFSFYTFLDSLNT